MYGDAIRNLLVTTAAAGTFNEAIYSEAHPSLKSTGAIIVPKTIEANETRAAFDVDDHYGRGFRQERTAWIFIMVLQFDTEAIMETFERDLLRSPLTVARDSSDGRDEQVNLLLEESAYEHPPRLAASNGTLATYRIRAEICPQ